MEQLSKFVLERMHTELGIGCLTNLTPSFDSQGKLTFTFDGYKISQQ
jgi:hypothetical protein